MMIRTAGGPGLISPIDYTERRRRPPVSNLVIFSAVVLAHVGLGAVLYYQRFEATVDPTPSPLPPAVKVTMDPPRIPPVAKPTPQQPVAPSTVRRPAPSPVPAPDPLPTETADTPAAAPGPVINFNPAPPTATGTAPTADPPRPPAVITRPDWVSRPSAAQMSRAFPDRALTDGIGGAATLRCQVQISGSLSGCAVTGETPDGKGFGRAALGLTRYFRLSPRTIDGQAVDGAAVVFTVRFGVEG